MIGLSPAGFIVSLIGGLLVAGAAILVFVVPVVWLARRAWSGSAPARPQSPLDVLGARYARGELNREQYLAMRRDLESGGER